MRAVRTLPLVWLAVWLLAVTTVICLTALSAQAVDPAPLAAAEAAFDGKLYQQACGLFLDFYNSMPPCGANTDCKLLRVRVLLRISQSKRNLNDLMAGRSYVELLLNTFEADTALAQAPQASEKLVEARYLLATCYKEEGLLRDAQLSADVLLQKYPSDRGWSSFALLLKSDCLRAGGAGMRRFSAIAG